MSSLENDFRPSEFLDFDSYSEASPSSKTDPYQRSAQTTDESASRKWARITGLVIGREKAVVNTVDDTLEAQFAKSSKSAFKHFGASSDLSRLFYSKGYIEVIGLGSRVVPLLLRDMKEKRRPWIFALEAITRQNAARHVEPGDIRSAINAWLVWGKRRRFLE